MSAAARIVAAKLRAKTEAEAEALRRANLITTRAVIHAIDSATPLRSHESPLWYRLEMRAKLARWGESGPVLSACFIAALAVYFLI